MANSKHPGEKKLKRLVIKYEGSGAAIQEYFEEKNGVEVKIQSVYKWLKDPNIRGLVENMRRARRARQQKERLARVKRGKKHIPWWEKSRRKPGKSIVSLPLAPLTPEEKNEPERLAKLWGLDVINVQKAWNWIILGKERQTEGRLMRVEASVFLLNAFKSTELDYLTVRSAYNLCYQNFRQDSPSLSSCYCCLDFLVKKMPGEIMVDKTSRPQIYFTSEKIAKVKAEREEEQRQAVVKKERLKQLLRQFIPESEGHHSTIVSSLKEQGITIGMGWLWKFIDDNEELNQLLKNVREPKEKRLAEARLARHAIKYPGEEESTSQAEEPVVEKDLPLSKEEIKVLLAYQEGDSIEALIGKTEIPGGKMDSIINSILAKKHVATFNKAKEKSQKELLTVQGSEK